MAFAGYGARLDTFSLYASGWAGAGCGRIRLSVGAELGFWYVAPSTVHGYVRVVLDFGIFGKWRPVPTLLACLLFAFTDALQARLQGLSLPGIGQIPVQAIQALPYVLTVLLLAGFVGRAMAPKAIGVPYVKER